MTKVHQPSEPSLPTYMTARLSANVRPPRPLAARTRRCSAHPPLDLRSLLLNCRGNSNPNPTPPPHYPVPHHRHNIMLCHVMQGVLCQDSPPADWRDTLNYENRKVERAAATSGCNIVWAHNGSCNGLRGRRRCRSVQSASNTLMPEYPDSRLWAPVTRGTLLL